MIASQRNSKERHKMELFVNAHEVNKPEDMARLFKEYTLLIWDYYMVGKIADIYTDDCFIEYGGLETVRGIDEVIFGTLRAISQSPRDKQRIFIDIFAEDNLDGTYSFTQMVAQYQPSLNDDKSFTPPVGRYYDDSQIVAINACECLVEKVDGYWKIVGEWIVGTSKK